MHPFSNTVLIFAIPLPNTFGSDILSKFRVRITQRDRKAIRERSADKHDVLVLRPCVLRQLVDKTFEIEVVVPLGAEYNDMVRQIQVVPISQFHGSPPCGTIVEEITREFTRDKDAAKKDDQRRCRNPYFQSAS